jgi:hypothetical protein
MTSCHYQQTWAIVCWKQFLASTTQNKGKTHKITPNFAFNVCNTHWKVQKISTKLRSTGFVAIITTSHLQAKNEQRFKWQTEQVYKAAYRGHRRRLNDISCNLSDYKSTKFWYNCAPFTSINVGLIYQALLPANIGVVDMMGNCGLNESRTRSLTSICLLVCAI